MHSDGARIRTVLQAHATQHLLTVLKHTHTLLRADGKTYKLILLDPPWENKSVQRSGSYPTLFCKALLSLPVPQLLAVSHQALAHGLQSHPSVRFTGLLPAGVGQPVWDLLAYLLGTMSKNVSHIKAPANAVLVSCWVRK